MLKKLTLILALMYSGSALAFSIPKEFQRKENVNQDPSKGWVAPVEMARYDMSELTLQQRLILKGIISLHRCDQGMERIITAIPKSSKNEECLRNSTCTIKGAAWLLKACSGKKTRTDREVVMAPTDVMGGSSVKFREAGTNYDVITSTIAAWATDYGVAISESSDSCSYARDYKKDPKGGICVTGSGGNREYSWEQALDLINKSIKYQF